MQLNLSERQRTTVAAAVTVVAAVVLLLTAAVFIWLLARFVNTFSSVFLPLAVAGVVALVFEPYYEWWVKRVRLPRPIAIVAVFLSILLPLGTLVWFFGGKLVDQLSDLIEKLPAWIELLTQEIQERVPQIRDLVERYGPGDLRNRLEEWAGSLLPKVGGTGLSVIKGILGAIGKLLGWAVIPVYVAFFLLIDRGRIRAWGDTALPFLKTQTRQDVTYLIREFVAIIVAFFRGQIVIAFIQGLLYAVGFEIIGLSYGFLLGLVLGFLNIVPYLGSIVGLSVALPLAFFQDGGGLHKVGFVLAVVAVVQVVEGYVLTPKIMGDRTGLHPMVIMVAIFFWGTALKGITGMVLAIPLTAFIVVFWRLAREKYIAEVL